MPPKSQTQKNKPPQETSQQATPATPTQAQKRNIDETVSPANTHDINTMESGGHIRAPNPIRRRNMSNDAADVVDAHNADNADGEADASLKLSHQGKTYNISQLIQATLSNKTFIDSIAPLLAETIQSHLNQMIEKATSPLQCQISAQRDSICTMQTEILEKANEIDELRSENHQLKDNIKGLTHRIEELEGRHDDLEQYGRRNNLRFHNVPMSDTDDTDDIVLDICNNKLKLSPPITKEDIDRSHTIGAIRKVTPDSKGTAQIICKFNGWKAKNKIYKAKSQLKKCKTPQFNVYINEDLTRKRQNMVKILSSARRANKIDSFWSNDGRVYYKETETSNKIAVKHISQIDLLE